jgi:hypothetical protein
VLEALVLGVVQVDELELLHAEELQAALDGAAHLFAGEVPSCEIAVCLGGEHEALRQAAHLSQDLADAPLALPVAVGGRRIEKVDPALENGPQGLVGPLPTDGVVEGFRHIPERRAPHAHRRDRETRTSKRPPR